MREFLQSIPENVRGTIYLVISVVFSIAFAVVLVAWALGHVDSSVISTLVTLFLGGGTAVMATVNTDR